MNILFVFDEARSTKNNAQIRFESSRTLFLELQHALWYFPQKCGAFTVVLDTTLRLSNSQPASKNSELFDPLYILSTTDVMSTPTFRGESLNDVVDPRILYRYGRPMWGAQLNTVSENKLDKQLQNMVILAKKKLVGGGNSLSKLDEQTLNENNRSCYTRT